MHHIHHSKLSNPLKIRFFIGFLVLIITGGISAITFASDSEKFEAGFSTSIKSKIRELLKQGKSDEEIIAYFVKRYGEWILRAPPVSGFNMVLWILPGTAIVTGLLWVLYRSRNWVEKPTKEMTGLTPEEEQKIMDDLGRFEKS